MNSDVETIKAFLSTNKDVVVVGSVMWPTKASIDAVLDYLEPYADVEVSVCMSIYRYGIYLSIDDYVYFVDKRGKVDLVTVKR